MAATCQNALLNGYSKIFNLEAEEREVKWKRKKILTAIRCVSRYTFFLKIFISFCCLFFFFLLLRVLCGIKRQKKLTRSATVVLSDSMDAAARGSFKLLLLLRNTQAPSEERQARILVRLPIFFLGQINWKSYAGVFWATFLDLTKGVLIHPHERDFF